MPYLVDSDVLVDLTRGSLGAASHSLTAYDVAFLDLAERLSLPLATCDRDLKEAALAVGIAVL